MANTHSHNGIAHGPLRKRLNNLFWEYRLGVSTRGIVDIDNPDSYHYATMFYSTIQKMVRFLNLQPTDVVVDIGSGRGRVLCCAARHPVRKVVGIDLSEELCGDARVNAQRMRERRSPIEVHQGFAQTFDYSTGTAFILFNPFGASTLDAVLTKIHNDVQTASASIRIAYANPLHEDVFKKHRWLQRYEYWDKGKLHLEHSIAFYKAVQ